MKLDDDIRSLKGVGEASAQQFGLLGIATIEALIDYYPRRYEDYSVISDINRIKPGPVTIRAIIQNAKGRYARRGLHITEVVASNPTGSVRLVWLNQQRRVIHLFLWVMRKLLLRDFVEVISQRPIEQRPGVTVRGADDDVGHRDARPRARLRPGVRGDGQRKP